MNIPRISPSHLLAQRLDALLGTKLAQQLASSTRPTTQEFIPQAARTPPLESTPQAPDRPPGPLPERPSQQTRQAPSQQARHTPPALNPPAAGPSGPQMPDVPGTPSAPISLGSTALLLVQLLRHFPSPPPAVAQAQPLLPSGPGVSGQSPPAPDPAAQASSPAAGTALLSSPTAAALFHSLEQAVRQSGLFYESHLAQFVAGRYPRAQLQAEPQARLADTPHPAAQPPETALTMRQQLETLALQTLSWRGEAWPQAGMQWTISRDDKDGAADTDELQQWSSQLSLTLPRLGEIHVRLHLTGQTLAVRLAAPQAEARLNAQADVLRQSMRAAGLTLSQLRISPVFEENSTEPPSGSADDGAAQTDPQSHE